MNSRQKTTGIVGIIVLAVTIAIFFLVTGRREAIDWACILLIIFAEIVFFCGGIQADKLAKENGGIFLRAGVFSSLAIYSILSIIVSLAFMFAVRNHIKFLLVIQLVILASYLIIFAVLVSCGQSIASKNRDVEMSISDMKALQDVAYRIMKKPSNEAFNAQISKVLDALRFSDNSTGAVKDKVIFEKLTSLEDYLDSDNAEKESEIDGKINELLWIIEQRNHEVQNMKEGRI